MKRLFSLLLALMMCLSLAACGNKADPGNETAAEAATPEAYENKVSVWR